MYEICTCPLCGRLHKSLCAGNPPKNVIEQAEREAWIKWHRENFDTSEETLMKMWEMKHPRAMAWLARAFIK